MLTLEKAVTTVRQHESVTKQQLDLHGSSVGQCSYLERERVRPKQIKATVAAQNVNTQHERKCQWYNSKKHRKDRYLAKEYVCYNTKKKATLQSFALQL